MEKHLNVPANTEELAELKSGDYVYLTGTIYTARDAAHKKMYETLLDGKELPVDVKGQFIYYLGPTPAREGQVIGSAGPTTSSRMDKYTPTMLDQGLKGMIGKGKRSSEVIESIKQNGAVYFAAVGGAGALLSKCIKEAEVIAYDDLGTEAIRKLRVAASRWSIPAAASPKISVGRSIIRWSKPTRPITRCPTTVLRGT